MKKTFNIIGSIMLALLIITVSILLIVNIRGIYNFFIDDFNNIHNLTKENIKENYDILIDYCLSFGERELNLKNLSMSEGGRFHFHEVRLIFQGVMIIFFISLMASIILAYINIRKFNDYSFIRNASIISMLLPIGLLIPIIFFFDQAFVIFHEIFFDNDLWIFNYKTDPIILYLPQDFFMVMGFLIVLTILIFSILGIYIYKRKKEGVI